MPYKVDVWGGDLHTEHAGSCRFEEWADAAAFMQERVDAGLLCNVLHTDFVAPPERVAEMEDAMIAQLSGAR